VGSQEQNQQRPATGEQQLPEISSFELLPAIDVAKGLSVRLSAGDENSEESFGSPLEIASNWISHGASWIHLVDLDAAFGRGENRKLIAEVVASCSSAKVQLSGGIRNDDSLAAATATGATRINLATSALTDMDWVETAIAKHGQLLSVSLDVSGSQLIARGTREQVGELEKILQQLEQFGCERYVVTDVARDGTLNGPNIELLEKVLSLTAKPVITSGGIANLSDLEQLMLLRPKGLAGAILGKALYVGRFSLEQALRIVAS